MVKSSDVTTILVFILLLILPLSVAQNSDSFLCSIARGPPNEPLKVFNGGTICEPISRGNKILKCIGSEQWQEVQRCTIDQQCLWLSSVPVYGTIARCVSAPPTTFVSSSYNISKGESIRLSWSFGNESFIDLYNIRRYNNLSKTTSLLYGKTGRISVLPFSGSFVDTPFETSIYTLTYGGEWVGRWAFSVNVIVNPVSLCGNNVCDFGEQLTCPTDCVIPPECTTGQTKTTTCSNGKVYNSKNCVNGKWANIQYLLDPCNNVQPPPVEENIFVKIINWFKSFLRFFGVK